MNIFAVLVVPIFIENKSFNFRNISKYSSIYMQMHNFSFEYKYNLIILFLLPIPICFCSYITNFFRPDCKFSGLTDLLICSGVILECECAGHKLYNVIYHCCLYIYSLNDNYLFFASVAILSLITSKTTLSCHCGGRGGGLSVPTPPRKRGGG